MVDVAIPVDHRKPKKTKKENNENKKIIKRQILTHCPINKKAMEHGGNSDTNSNWGT